MRTRRVVAMVLVVVGACIGASTRSGATPAEAGRDPHPPAVAASPWPAAIHDASHSGTSSFPGPTSGRVRWTRRLEGDVTPGPVVGIDGAVYAASNAGVLHALDPATGADRWVFDGGGGYGNDLSTSPAVLGDGTVLWPGPRNRLYGLDSAGRLVWSERFEAAVLSPAVGRGDVVYVMSADGILTRLDAAGGRHRRRWSIHVGDVSYGSPAIGGDGTVYTSVDTSVVAVVDDAISARVAWRFDTHRVVEVSPAVGPDGTVVIGTNGRLEYGIRAGRVRWRYDRHAKTYSSAAVTPGGTAWFGDHHGYLDGVNAHTGTPERRVLGLRRGRPSPGVWTSPAIDSRGNVYFGTRPGHVYGFAANGRRLFDINTGATVDSYPALTADGTLLIGSSNGTLYALRDAPK